MVHHAAAPVYPTQAELLLDGRLSLDTFPQSPPLYRRQRRHLPIQHT
ncbi:MAG: hypothetical protein KBE23_07470 [Chloroflexi bacterium]|nr:hypothetical protein [Chloroflexota bacterium]MBP7042568.1 hypothetical protein [Chloroflexota bacterium]